MDARRPETPPPSSLKTGGSCVSLYAFDMRPSSGCRSDDPFAVNDAWSSKNFPDTPFSGSYHDHQSSHQSVTDFPWQTVISNDWLQRHAPVHNLSPSKEESLLKERRRISSQGLVAYEHVDNTIMFAYHQGIYVGSLEPYQAGFDPFPIPNAVPDSVRLDPKLGGDPKLVSFIRDRDLYLCDFSGREQRLTWSACSEVSNGIAEYIMQEEFRRFTSYWWNPVAYRCLGGIEKERMLYLRTDHTAVEVVRMERPGNDGEKEEYRYPKAGKANVIAKPLLLEFGKSLGEEVTERALRGPFQLNCAFPWLEYIVRAGWTPCGKFAHFQLLNRLQTRIVLVLVPTSLFMTETEYLNFENGSPFEPMQVLVDESAPNFWINVTDIPTFFPTATGATEFLWASERTGFRHLYMGIIPVACSAGRDSRDTRIVTHPETGLRQLTDGDWGIVDHPVSVDVNKRRVFFMAKKDGVLENHLYVVSMDPSNGLTSISYSEAGVRSAPSRVTRLTALGSSHIVTLNERCTHFVDVSSAIDAAPSCEAGIISDSESVVKMQLTGRVVPKGQDTHERDRRKTVPVPEVFSFLNSQGIRLHGLLYKPVGFYNGIAYPTILRVYGGPNVQVVTNDYKHPRLSRVHLAVSLGYCVVLVDGRGSDARGTAFEGAIRHRLGTLEMRDQIEALAYLALRDNGRSGDGSEDLRNCPVDWSDLEKAWGTVKSGIKERRWGSGGCIDLDRIAVTGWSYGGYLSLLMLVHHPDIFKMCLAGAPVTNWELYDTAYTERYMGLPSDNPVGYAHGCIYAKATDFPNEENRLLVAHGMQDENVHFKNSQMLIEALVKHNKPHQVQVYPSERHGLHTAHVVEHFETLMFWWLGRYL
ncbi:dipeptidylpeptidase [Thoreauomyces humboldtii]|nr:dipeptidylpeptidase [Thoreauomyces humboldtii]